MSTIDGRLARGEERKQLLLDSAVAVVADRGSGALTHRAVSTAAGVSVASVTYHFPSVLELRTAMFDHAGSRIGLVFRALVLAHQGEPDQLPVLAGDYARTLVSSARQDTIAVYEMILAATHDPALQHTIRELNGHLADLLTSYVGGRDTGLHVAAAIQGLILTHLATTVTTTNTDVNELRDDVADLIRRFAAHC